MPIDSISMEMKPLMVQAQREGVLLDIDNEYCDWFCRGCKVYIPKKKGSSPTLTFCHEWGHARLFIERRSPVFNQRLRSTVASEIMSLSMQERRRDSVVVLQEEILAWSEVPTMMRIDSSHHNQIINLFTTYLDAFEIEESRRSYWLDRLPLV